jgi:hypothetical protein
LLETIIEALSWFIGIMLFYFCVPKSKKRQAFVGILVMQMFTWPLGFLVAEFELISYPSRFFDNATTASFTFEYFLFPVIGAIFNIYYPRERSLLKVFTYTSVIVSLLTTGEVILEVYTDNIEYLQWDWYWSWITMFVLLHVSYRVFNKFMTK